MTDHDAYIGLDVHKDSISVAIADTGRSSEVRVFGAIPNEPTAISKLVKKLSAGTNGLSLFTRQGRVDTMSFGKLRRWALFAG